MKTAVQQTGQAGNEYPPITVDNIMETARRAAYVAIRRAYNAKARTVKDKSGNVIAYDGNVGGNKKMQELKERMSRTTCAARERMERAASDYDSNPNAETAKTYAIAADEYAQAVGNDTDDCIQVAAASLWQSIHENGGEIAPDGAFVDALRAVHRYIYSEDKNTATRVRRTYNEKGELQRISDYEYIKYQMEYLDEWRENADGDGYTVTQIPASDEYKRVIQADEIQRLYAVLPRRAKQVLYGLYMGYTYESIGRKCGITKQAVYKYRKMITDIAAEYIGKPLL